MGLRKFLKKARKTLGLPAITVGNVAKIAAATAIGGPGAGVLTAVKSKLKSAAIGGIKQVLRTKAQKAHVQRIATLSPPKVVDIRATTMPGGAPLRGVRVKATRRKAAAKAAAPRKAARKGSGGGRKPPKGGKDLKALSVSWKAAGKPGRWLDWVKTH